VSGNAQKQSQLLAEIAAVCLVWCGYFNWWCPPLAGDGRGWSF